MYNTKFLLEALDKVIESGKEKLNDQELRLLCNIRTHIADNSDEKKIEDSFFELIKWLLVIIEYLKNTS
jgi:hypothetical protein